ncbi:transmembrane protein 186 [Odontomachus brunneus]|uniref:transmembrane protein 186 n=1 Tax=Odontomachus brunneus TaxID=486640 RepID=UPI0013F26F51|nr:transmembrane protein 186 [Odontomachus brunneus]
MYTRLALKFCERALHRGLISSRLQCSTLSHATKTDVEKQTMDLTSKRFPGYKLIYVFPYIAHVAAFNGAKRRFTYVTGAVVPVAILLELMSAIPFEITAASTVSTLLISAFLHINGILCNNLVGIIYINLEEGNVILSYIDYWGRRLDLKTNIDDVIPLSDNRLRITDPLYKKILFISQKKTLKINMKLGKIMDVQNFKSVLGTV